MKKACVLMAVLAVLALSAVSTAQAAAITWGAATNIAGGTDVLATGTPVYAYAFGTDVGAQTVNTVDFSVGNLNSGGGNVTMTGAGLVCGPYFPLSSPPSYNGILRGAVFGSSGPGITVALNNLVEGQEYAVQVWSGNVDYGGSDTTYDGAVSLAMIPGQYAIGTFTADGTGSQVMSLTGTNYQINALQLREAGQPPVPEPAGLALLGLAGLALCRKRRVLMMAMVVVLALSAVSTAQADATTWGAPQTINSADPTQVSTVGTSVYAYAFGNWGDTWTPYPDPIYPIVVNTVAFQPNPANNQPWGGDNLIFSPTPVAVGPYFPPFANIGYDGILHGAAFAGTWGMGLNHLTNGVKYAVQVWTRQTNYGYQQTIIDGGTAPGGVTLLAAGEYAIGTFTAGATPQWISVAGAGAQINAMQVRTLPLVGDLRINKWNDLDGDGQWVEDNDPLLGGWTFSVSGVSPTLTDNGPLDEDSTPGTILVTGLDPGQYTIMENLAGHDGWNWTHGLLVATVNAGEEAVADWANHYTPPSGVPEPAGLGMMGLLLLAVRKRRS